MSAEGAGEGAGERRGHGEPADGGDGGGNGGRYRNDDRYGIGGAADGGDRYGVGGLADGGDRAHTGEPSDGGDRAGAGAAPEASGEVPEAARRSGPRRRPPGATAVSGPFREPVDPDVDLHIPADRAEAVGHHLWTVIAVVAAGGVIGACARYGASLVWPVAAGTFPWTTFGVNAVGCALIGVLMVLVVETREAHPLVRPFLGTGVLGGFTTFSTYAVDLVELLDRGRAGTAAGYAAGTLGAALGGVAAAAALTRAAVRRRTAPGVPAGNGGGSR